MNNTSNKVGQGGQGGRVWGVKKEERWHLYRKDFVTTQIQTRTRNKTQTSEARLNHTCVFPLVGFGIVITPPHFASISLRNSNNLRYSFKISLSLYHHQPTKPLPMLNRTDLFDSLPHLRPCTTIYQSLCIIFAAKPN